jgi:hypothetical protein
MATRPKQIVVAVALAFTPPLPLLARPLTSLWMVDCQACANGEGWWVVCGECGGSRKTLVWSFAGLCIP